MASPSSLNPESEDFNQTRPPFFIGQHDSKRDEVLTDDQYSYVLQTGVSRGRIINLASFIELTYLK